MEAQNKRYSWKTFLGVLGFIITVISFFFAVYQYQKSEELEEIVRKRAWSQYKRIANAHGELQYAIKKYEDIYKDNPSPVIIKILNKVDGMEYGVINSAIEYLDYYEDFTLEKIDELIQNKRINESHRVFFEPLCER